MAMPEPSAAQAPDTASGQAAEGHTLKPSCVWTVRKFPAGASGAYGAERRPRRRGPAQNFSVLSLKVYGAGASENEQLGAPDAPAKSVTHGSRVPQLPMVIWLGPYDPVRAGPEEGVSARVPATAETAV